MTAASLKLPEYDSRLYGHIGEERTKTLYYETSGAGQPGQLDAAGQVFESVAVQGNLDPFQSDRESKIWSHESARSLDRPI